MVEETPSNLIRSTIENFQIEPDLATLDRITENLDLLAEKRSGRTNEQRDILKSESLESNLQLTFRSFGSEKIPRGECQPAGAF